MNGAEDNTIRQLKDELQGYYAKRREERKFIELSAKINKNWDTFLPGELKNAPEEVKTIEQKIKTCVGKMMAQDKNNIKILRNAINCFVSNDISEDLHAELNNLKSEESELQNELQTQNWSFFALARDYERSLRALLQGTEEYPYLIDGYGAFSQTKKAIVYGACVEVVTHRLIEQKQARVIRDYLQYGQNPNEVTKGCLEDSVTSLNRLVAPVFEKIEEICQEDASGECQKYKKTISKYICCLNRKINAESGGKQSSEHDDCPAQEMNQLELEIQVLHSNISGKLRERVDIDMSHALYLLARKIRTWHQLLDGLDQPSAKVQENAQSPELPLPNAENEQ